MSKTLNSLGIAKPVSETRVVVAMSGGVDSSVCAALLHEEGYDVVGVTLQLYDYGDANSPGAQAVKSKTCCAGQDIYDARRVAEDLDFPHYVLNYESNFRESVIDDFADSYIRGETPIPCVKCNQTVKFRDLLQVAYDLGADCMATGHYIKRTVDKNGKAHLERAHDDGKDQSYFLFATTQEQLDFLRFPLGGWSKDVTREHAERLGLTNANKPDSQDICFVPHGDYAKVVKKMRPEAQKAGKIVHIDGREVGEHEGIIHYTIGQRRGLGIGGLADPLYVIKLDADRKEVVVGPKAMLATRTIPVKEINWLGDAPLTSREEWHIAVKVRSTRPPRDAILRPLSETTAEIELFAAEEGVSPGQACVFYDTDSSRIYGGGWIHKG